MKRNYALYWNVLTAILSFIVLGLLGVGLPPVLAAVSAPTVAPSPAYGGPPPGPTIQWVLARGPQQEVSTLDEYVQHQNVIDTVARYTNGRLKIVHRTLGPPNQVLDVVRDRRADLGLQVAAFRAELALWYWGGLPGLSMDDVLQVWPHVQPIIQDSFQKNFGVVYGFSALFGPQLIFSKTPLKTIEDFKGMKVRAQSKESSLLIQQIGAVPTTISYPEVYMALQRGVVDASISAVRGVINVKWNELLKYANAWPVGQNPWAYVINKDSWAALPDELKPFVREALKDAADKAIFFYGKAVPFEDQGLIATSGMTLVKPSKEEIRKMVKAAEQIRQDWAKRAGPSGPEVLRIIKEVLGQ